MERLRLQAVPEQSAAEVSERQDFGSGRTSAKRKSYASSKGGPFQALEPFPGSREHTREDSAKKFCAGRRWTTCCTRIVSEGGAVPATVRLGEEEESEEGVALTHPATSVWYSVDEEGNFKDEQETEIKKEKVSQLSQPPSSSRSRVDWRDSQASSSQSAGSEFNSQALDDRAS